jgi:tRNA(Ile)-lysidine synthase TilS/MesJ
MRVCINCVLPETFPGIRFNDEGVCNFCLDAKSAESREAKKAEYRERFETLLKEYKGKSSYDALMCYSGGKDSTYTLALLRERYSLNILALTFDNGFLAPQAYENIRSVVECLGVDHILFKPRFDILTKIFGEGTRNDIFPPKTLERASTICTSCIGIVKNSGLRLAVEKSIPFVAFGWSPGQAPITSSIMKNNPRMVNMMQKTIYEPLHRLVGNDIRPYFLEDSHFDGSYDFPYNIHPLAFLEYSEEDIYQEIARLGWEAPTGVDANSTNCLLNSFANAVHKKRFGFHPYAFEMANLVREGYVEREVALEKIDRPEDPSIVALARERLGISKELFDK